MQDSWVCLGVVMLHGYTRWHHVLAKNTTCPPKAVRCPRKPPLRLSQKTAHQSFIFSAPKSYLYRLKTQKSPNLLFHSFFTKTTAQAICNTLNLKTSELTTICCLKKLETHNSRNQFIVEAIVPFTFTIEPSLQARPLISRYSWEK